MAPFVASRLPRIAVLIAALSVLGRGVVRAQSEDPVPPFGSPDGLWEVAGSIPFPDGFSAPRRYLGTTLDLAALKARLAGAPREQPGRFTSPVVISLPLPDGRFPAAGVVLTQVMERELAAEFPDIGTYTFEGISDRHLTGHMVVGPGTMQAVAQTRDGLLRIDPIETSAGTFYLSYLDVDRTDGSNILEHAHDEHPPTTGIPVTSAPPDAESFAAAPAPAAIEIGDTLHTYRLAAATTGQFYQARLAADDPNVSDDVEVLVSILGDVAGVNAVLEPEVGVRIILANATLALLYDDPLGDPFNNSDTPCNLREANRDNNKAIPVDDGDYDLGFLLATQSSGGNSGCAWFVLCLTTDDTLHKARGAGKIGNNGTNSASGLMLHEMGHQIGANHTYSGQAGGCDVPNFSETGTGPKPSAYEPGSGSTIMSYRGNCADQAGNPPPPPPPPLQNDNVDMTADALGSQYYHTASFDQIANNITSGDGSTCGNATATGNEAPDDVDAGPDFTIPRGTPFTLTGFATDEDPMTFTWEQFDLAATQRPIDTDDGLGPIIRSVPPTTDMSRTIPNLSDLVNGLTPRRGEILPSMDRDLNFRFIARDNRMGGGGVAYDSMVVHVLGDPFFLTSPNGGEIFQSGCPAAVTWTVGGGDVADDVDLLFSEDGGFSYTPLLLGTPNDGSAQVTMACESTGQGRVKAAAADNIFFDISDANFTVVSEPPDVTVSAIGGEVDDTCAFLVTFSATVTDDCGVGAGDVTVNFFKAEDNFTLGTPVVHIVQSDALTVLVDGSVLVSDLTSSPAKLAVSVTAADLCGAETNDFAEAVVVDTTPPEITVDLSPPELWAPNHSLVEVTATVIATDNCPGVGFVLTSVTSDEPDNGAADGDTDNDIQNAATGTPDPAFSLRAERAGTGDGRTYTATYTATDGSGNEAEDSDTVDVPHAQND